MDAGEEPWRVGRKGVEVEREGGIGEDVEGRGQRLGVRKEEEGREGGSGGREKKEWYRRDRGR